MHPDKGAPIYRPTKPTKALVAAAFLLFGALNAAFGDDVVNWGEAGEFVSLLVETVIGAIAVYKVPNKPTE